jgi:A/G-specific adenine glycosylase
MSLEKDIRELQEAAWDYYAVNGRHDLPWRQAEADGTFSAYKILVSELMLQQTQVPRVVPKFEAFLRHFPSMNELAAALLGDVLREWQGLGYNRRAKFLWQAAQKVTSECKGVIPKTATELVSLPGIGVNTAGAILAYAFDQPVTFIETNVRTVVIYHCFREGDAISDKQIREVVEQAVQGVESPREWYWALMDYGSALKKTHGNLNKLSNSYSRQSPFHGSKRQVRGKILRLLSAQPIPEPAIFNEIQDERTSDVLQELLDEGLIQKNDGMLHL